MATKANKYSKVIKRHSIIRNSGNSITMKTGTGDGGRSAPGGDTSRLLLLLSRVALLMLMRLTETGKS